MPLTDPQVRQLRAKLDGGREDAQANGTDLHYVEGWHVIAEANRIFGYDAWGPQDAGNQLPRDGAVGQHYAAAYTAKVRVSVRAGEVTIVREDRERGKLKPSPRGKRTSSR